MEKIRHNPLPLSAHLLALSAVLLAPNVQAQHGEVAATHAFRNTWNYSSYEYSNNCTNFVSKCQYEGGWRFIGTSPYLRTSSSVWYKTSLPQTTSYTWAGANNFENHIIITGRATRTWDSSSLQPGDIIVADWGNGTDPATATADGIGDHVMIVHHNLGNGDVVYCQHSSSKMRRLNDVKSFLYKAQFRLYRVKGNYALQGRTEGRLYREASRPEVYLFVNRGKFWVRTLEDVMYWGGWGGITVVPDGTLSGYGGALPIEGTMVRERNRPEVYLVSNWPYIRHILSESAVNRYGGWAAVRIVPDYSLNSYWRSTDIW